MTKSEQQPVMINSESKELISELIKKASSKEPMNIKYNVKEIRQVLVKTLEASIILTISTIISINNLVYASNVNIEGSVRKLREAFDSLTVVAMAIVEPILWFYAIAALVLMATGKSKSVGWGKLKSIGYSYIGVVMLPTIFAFLKWIGNILSGAFSSF